MGLGRRINLNRRNWLITGFILLAGAALYMWFAQSRAANSTYQTAPVTRGVLTASVGATGTVRAAQTAVLVWNTSGRVAEVNAAIGDKFSSDQVLALLAPSSLPKTILLASADLVTAQQNLDTLLRSNSSAAQAMQTLANAKQAVKDAQDGYNSLTRKRVSDELINDTRDQINRAEDQLKRTEYLYRLFFSHLADGNPTKAQMIVNITNSRQNIANLTAKYNWYTSKASTLDVEKAQTALNVVIARQEDAQRELDRFKDGTNMDDLAAAKARVAAAQATFNQSMIIAPFNGTITQVQTQPGNRVSAGDFAFRLDDLTRLMVDLQISEVDINNVTTELPVSVTFDSIPNKTFHGVVSKVNQSAKAGQGAVNFTVSITISDANEQVKPGMTADVTITVKQVGDALLVPNRALRMLDGQRIVYVLRDGEPAAVNIRLGATTDTTSQVVGGDLKEGDLIILNPPAMTSLSLEGVNPVPSPAP